MSPSRRSFRSSCGQLKAVGGGGHGLQPAPAGVAGFQGGDQQAGPGQPAPAHPAAELVQLGDPEPVGVKDDHEGCVVDVDAHLDHRGGDQQLGPVGRKVVPWRRTSGPGPAGRGAEPGELRPGPVLPGGARRRPSRMRVRGPAVSFQIRRRGLRFPGAEVAVVVRSDLGADDVHLVARRRSPPGTRDQMRPAQAGFSASPTTWVEIGARPAGSSSSTDVSRSPKTVIATVRGMGVAVMTSRCGGLLALARRASRCSTPKRCCSSTTIRPRS